MTRWQRRSASAKRWVVKEQPQSRPASGGGEAAVAAVGAPQAAVAVGEAAVAAHDKGALPALKEARNGALECVLSSSDVEQASEKHPASPLSMTATAPGQMPTLRLVRSGAARGSPEAARQEKHTCSPDGRHATKPATSATLGGCLGIGANGQQTKGGGTVWTKS